MEQYVRIDGLQLDANVITTTRGIFVDSDGSNAATPKSTSPTASSGRAIPRPFFRIVRAITALDNFSGADNLFVAKVWNNLVYGWTGSTSALLLNINNDGTLYAYNNTVIGPGVGQTGSKGLDGCLGQSRLCQEQHIHRLGGSLRPRGHPGSPSTNNVSDSGERCRRTLAEL